MITQSEPRWQYDHPLQSHQRFPTIGVLSPSHENKTSHYRSSPYCICSIYRGSFFVSAKAGCVWTDKSN